MKKRNRFLVALVLILMVAVSMTALFACVDPNIGDKDKDDTIIETRDQLLSNGTFYNSTSSTSKERYVKDTLASWSKTSGAIGYSSAVMGAIDVTKLKDNYNLVWDSAGFQAAAAGSDGNGIGYAPNSPEDVDANGVITKQDNYAAVISSGDKEASVYYSSSSAKIEKDKYYRLSIDVWTYIDKQANQSGEGAYIFVTDGVYSEWSAIDTDSKWETYTLFVEGSKFEDRSFSVQLWLGHGPSKIGSEVNERLTKGVALFDNVILKEISQEEYKGCGVDANINLVDGASVKNASLVFPDTEFDYNRAISSSSTASSTTKSYYSARVGAPYNYTQVVGKTDLTSDKPYVSSAGNSAPYGIFDLAKFYKKTTEEGKDTWKDTFAQINTTEFAAPAWQDFFAEDGTFNNNARATAQTGYKLNDTRALLIFNNQASGIGYKSDKKLQIKTGYYYEISVWVYVYKALMLPHKIVTTDGKPAELTEPQMNENVAAIEKYNVNHPKAHIKLTGASLQNAGELQEETSIDTWKESPLKVDTVALKGEDEVATGKYNMTVEYNTEEGGDAVAAREGYWAPVTFYVQGNVLSDRQVNVEFWLGEGTKNDVDELEQGGAIFDNLSIRSSDKKSEVDPDATYEELSPFNFENANDFAGLTDEEQNKSITEIPKNKKAEQGADGSGNRENQFTLKFADGVNSPDSALKSYIVGAKAPDKDTNPGLAGLPADNFKEWAVKVGEADKFFNTILMRNLNYTASSLTVNPTAAIYPNNYYRLSMWIKTVGIDDAQGATINLLLRNTESDYQKENVVSSFTTVNTKGEWKEYVFYVSGNYVDTKDASGAELKHNEITVQYTLGTGDSYNTSTHVKGDLIVGALNIQSAITYSEYNSAASGDTLKKYAFTSNVATDNTVSGGRFNSVDYDGTVKAYNDKNQNETDETKKLPAYDNNGNLAGVGKPSSTTWSLTTPVANQVATPTGMKIDSTNLEWTGSADAAYYEIFFKDTIVGKVEAKAEAKADEDNKYQMLWARPFTNPGTFYVRAVPKNPAEKLISNKNSITTSSSANGVTISYTDWYKENKDKYSETKDYENNFGIIDFKNFDEKNLDALKKNGASGLNSINDIRNLYHQNDNRYPNLAPNEARYYFGTEGILSDLYNNVLMLSSQYKTRGGYTMYSSTSLSSESYYEISVWVKTMGDATASFTIDNSTNTFYNTAKTDYIGFNNIKTNGEWVQLKLYAKTGLASANFKLKLFMGDPYVKDYTNGEGLCSGTVFFDDIVMKKLADKNAYDKLLTDKEEYKGNGVIISDSTNHDAVQSQDNVYTDLEYELNAYAFMKLDFLIDSFDVTTESTTTATGAKPDDYSQTILGDNTTVSDAHQSKVAYGVYNVPDITDDKFAYLYENFQENGDIPAWFGINDIDSMKSFMQGYGDNVLVMANFLDNGMYYKSSTKSIKATSYYQISFYAKLKAPEGKTGEVRFYHGDDTTKYEAVKISGTGDMSIDFGFKKYTIYVYNASSSSVSSNYITFNLGTKTETDDGTVTDYFRGMMIIDNVEISETTAEIYDKAQLDAGYEGWSDDQKKTATGSVNFTTFKAQSANPDDEKPAENKGWDSATWLIFSTSLIGAMIVVAVAVVLIRNFRKKHIKAKAPEVESNIKVEGYASEKKEAKKDADRREFDD